MEDTEDSKAWLTKQDGSVIIGHGPFQEFSSPPAGQLAFYIQTFALDDPAPWKVPSRVESISAAEITGRVQGAEPPVIHWNAMDAAEFSVVFQEVMAAIHGGIFEKTVPIVTETGVAAANPAAALMNAMIRQPAPLHSYGWIKGERGFAGATPERLFSLELDRVETMALAGTARSEDRDVFAVDEKEIREHEYVAQTLVSKLLDLGQITRHSRKILDLGSIVHFLTNIELDLLSPLTAESLLRRLHPTPALGPLPRTSQTLNLLHDWRQRLGCPAEFGAPFGLMESDRFEAVVAIRGIWWNNCQICLPAGCGIIEASRLVNEWRELRLKRESVKRFLVQK